MKKFAAQVLPLLVVMVGFYAGVFGGREDAGMIITMIGVSMAHANMRAEFKS